MLRAMTTSVAVAERLARLTIDQRAAATAPPGPVLCVAPAGSGKTTTLVARIAWLIDGGAAPDTIAAITFNKRAAEELGGRLDVAVAPLGVAGKVVRVRTFHALGREILRDAGTAVEPLLDRASIVEELWPGTTAAELGRLDTAFSRLKLDLGVSAAEIAADPDAGPVARAFVAYEAAIAARGGLDFDDLVRRALDALEGDAGLLARWRRRCSHLLVDEVQDVDRSQLRLALLLAAPANRIFLVGDDDQSIYGWRLADVRRVLALDASLPGLRRVDLEVNHRCPVPVVERAVRLIEHNRERFVKVVRPRPDAPGRSSSPRTRPTSRSGPSGCFDRGPTMTATRAVLARTNRELRPAVLAALALGEPFRAPSVELLVDDPALDGLLARVADETDPRLPAARPSGWLAAGRGRRWDRGGTKSCRGPAGLGAALPRPRGVRRRDRGDARPPGRPSPRRCPPEPGDGPLDQGRRVRPCRGGRHGGGSLSRAVAPSPKPTSRTGPWKRSDAWATSPGPAPDGR